MTPQEWRDLPPSRVGVFPGLDRDAVARFGKLALVKPSPAFEGFVRSSEIVRCTLLRAANQVGKTYHACLKLVREAIVCPNRYRITGPTFRQTVAVSGKYLNELIPPSLLRNGSVYSARRGWRDRLIELANGSIIEILSYDQDPDAHAGGQIKGFILDEAPPEPIFHESMARLTSVRDAWTVIAATMVGRPKPYLRKIVEAPGSPWRQTVVGFNAESCPWLSQEMIEARILDCLASPATYGARILGEWPGLTEGRVFTGYDPAKHLRGRDSWAKSVTHWRIGLDHGKGKNRQVAVLVGLTLDRKGVNAAHIFREFRSTGRGALTPEQIAAGIVAMIRDVADFGDLAVNILLGRLKIIGDTNAAGLGVDDKYNAVIAQELKALGVPNRIDNPNKRAGSVGDGEALLNALALRDGLSIDPACELMSDALGHYVGVADLKDPVDALRYATQDLLSTRGGIGDAAAVPL